MGLTSLFLRWWMTLEKYFWPETGRKFLIFTAFQKSMAMPMPRKNGLGQARRIRHPLAAKMYTQIRSRK